MVEIARASAFNSSVVIFDEPTASLTLSEAQSLFATIAELKAKGVAVVYISHKMSEVFAISDRITVLRDGEMRGTLNTVDTDEKEITRLMIGRDLDLPAPKSSRAGREELLGIKDIHVPGWVRGVSLSVRRGEVLGLYGLVGAGPHRNDGSGVRRAQEIRRQHFLEGRGGLHSARPAMRSSSASALSPKTARARGWCCRSAPSRI